MRTTIKEAMQLKNEVAAAIQRRQQGFTGSFRTETNVRYGTTTKDGQVQEAETDSITFPAMYDLMIRAYAISEKLHQALALANVTVGIGDLIRKRENIKALIRMLETAQTKGKAYIRTESTNVIGGGLINVRATYEPFMTSTAAKERVRVLKRELREAQGAIERGNTTFIDIPNLTVEEVEGLLDDA